MKLDKALTWFFYGWVGLVVVLNIIGIAGMIYTAPTVWAGIAKVQDTYSPFNIINYAVEVVSLSPAIAAFIWRDRRRAKR